MKPGSAALNSQTAALQSVPHPASIKCVKQTIPGYLKINDQ